MKFISAIFALFMMLSLSAQADLCYREAIRNDSSFGLALSPDQAIKLCARSHDAGSPLTCYREAIRNDSGFALGLGPDQAIELCAGARNLTPISCYREAIRNDSAFAMGLSLEQAVSYCRSN